MQGTHNYTELSEWRGDNLDGDTSPLGGDESDEIRSNTCQELTKQREEKRSSQLLLSGEVSLSSALSVRLLLLLLLLSSPAAAFTVTQREAPVCRIYSSAARDPEQSRGARSGAERGGEERRGEGGAER